jgi:hypothetical protein
LKHVLDYVVTHDKAGQRLVCATGCGRAELDLPWVIKRKPDFRDAIHWVMWLHCRLCNAVGLQPWDTEIGTITFEGVAHHSAAQAAAGNDALPPAP